MTTRISYLAGTLKTIALAAALSAIAATAASAQAAISEPAAFQALYPYRDVLNNGAPTPAAPSQSAAAVADRRLPPHAGG